MELETINEIARVGEEGENTHPLRLRALEAVTLTDITKVHFSQVESKARVERGRGKGAEPAVLTRRDKVPLWFGSGTLKRST